MADNPPIAQNMLVARDTRGKSLFAQVSEIARLAFSGFGLTADEYYSFRLYDDRAYSFEDKRRFLSDSAFDPIIRRVCDLRWWAVADDKLLTYTLLQAYGLRIPAIKAVVHPWRSAPGAAAAHTVEELARLLREEMTYPFFQKPVSGVQSRNVTLVERYDAEADALVEHDGTTRPVEEWAAWLFRTEGQSRGDGHLIQEVLRPHPELRRLTGDRIGSVRIMVLFDDDGPQIVGATWKITAAGNVADNFWRSGNMLGHVDHETGEVLRVIRGEGPGLEEMPVHPDTGEKLVGARLPDWEALRELVLAGARLMPKIRFQGWDIAMCEDGPTVIEANTGSSTKLAQLASGQGFLTDRILRFIDWGTSVNETVPWRYRRKRKKQQAG